MEIKGLDRYQRTIADVILPDGRVLNYEIVKVGLAWWFRRYVPNDPNWRDSNSKLEKQGIRFGLRFDDSYTVCRRGCEQ